MKAIPIISAGGEIAIVTVCHKITTPRISAISPNRSLYLSVIVNFVGGGSFRSITFHLLIPLCQCILIFFYQVVFFGAGQHINLLLFPIVLNTFEYR